LEEHKRPTLAVVTSSGSTDTVNVVTRVIRRIELDNPVNRRNLSRVSKLFLRKFRRNTYIKTTSSNISADQGALLGVTELEEGVGSLLLLLLAVEVKNRKINIVEKFGMVFHTGATTEEDDDLLLEVALEE
jgi:hypothetical protein